MKMFNRIMIPFCAGLVVQFAFQQDMFVALIALFLFIKSYDFYKEYT